MNPQGADLLSQLRDIHSAPAAPWWPPAPGWWVVALLAAIGLIFVARYFTRQWRRQLRRRKLAGYVQAIETGIDPAADPQGFLAAINRIFKLVAIEAFPGSHCVQMRGADWTGFLQRHMSPQPGTEHLEVLADGPYQPRPRFDDDAMLRLARQWISQYG
jgi:hypothetical protein